MSVEQPCAACGDAAHMHVCVALAPRSHTHRTVFYCDACNVHFGITHVTVEHKRVVLLYAPMPCPGFSSETALSEAAALYATFAPRTLPCCDCCADAACKRPAPAAPQPPRFADDDD